MEQTENMAQDTIPVAENNESKILLNTNQISAALMLIFTGEFLYRIPLDTWSVKIMWITAWIAILIGTIQLYNNLRGNGRKAAGLWIAATVFSIIAIPFEIINSLTEGIATIAQTSEDTASSSLGAFQAYLQWFLSLGSLMYIGGALLFMTYQPFTRIRTGWIWLIATFVLSIFSLPSLFILIPLFIGFYLIITRLYNYDNLSQRRAGALLWMASGLLYSLFILLNNDTIYIIASLAGLIAWLIGVVKVRSLEYGNKGTSLFIVYAILMFISSILHLLPGLIGDGLAIILQIPAYTILIIGFFQFNRNSILVKQENDMNGMHTMIGVAIICLILAFVYLIPLLGEPISAMVFSVLCVPSLTLGWKNALTACPDKKIEIPITITGESLNINWKILFATHKKTIIASAIIIVLLFAVSKINTNSLAEGWLNEASNIISSNSEHMTEIANPENQAVVSLVKKAAWLGNNEAKMYRSELTLKEIQQIYSEAEKGEEYAQYAIGFLFRFYGPIVDHMKKEEGEKVIRWLAKHGCDNTNIQFKWLNAAALQGHPRAQYLIDNAYQTEREENYGFEEYLKLANEGNANAQNAIGECYARGNGVKSDKQEALKWWRKAAQNNNTDAQVRMGDAYSRKNYFDDSITPYSREEALKWYLMAAEKGNAQAQFEAAMILKNPAYKARDLNEAEKWLRNSANQGHKKAKDELHYLEYMKRNK